MEKVRRKKMQVREKVGKSRFTVFFQWFGAPEGRKVNSLKRRVRSQLARWEMKNCTPLWREAHFQVKMYKTHHVRTTFGSWDVEKVHAVVARIIFPSQNVQNTPTSDRFLTFRCRKSVRRCGAKHIPKSKVLKTGRFGPLFDDQMSKKWTLTLTFNYTTIHSIKLHYNYNSNYNFTTTKTTTTTTTTLHPLHHTTLHYVTLHYTTLHHTRLHCTALHYITFHYATLHYTTPHYTTLRYTTLHCTTLHSTTLRPTTLHYITLHYATLHYTTLDSTTLLHYTTLQYATLHNTTLHCTTLHPTTPH